MLSVRSRFDTETIAADVSPSTDTGYRRVVVSSTKYWVLTFADIHIARFTKPSPSTQAPQIPRPPLPPAPRRPLPSLPTLTTQMTPPPIYQLGSASTPVSPAVMRLCVPDDTEKWQQHTLDRSDTFTVSSSSAVHPTPVRIVVQDDTQHYPSGTPSEAPSYESVDPQPVRQLPVPPLPTLGGHGDPTWDCRLSPSPCSASTSTTSPNRSPSPIRQLPPIPQPSPQIIESIGNPVLPTQPNETVHQSSATTLPRRDSSLPSPSTHLAVPRPRADSLHRRSQSLQTPGTRQLPAPPPLAHRNSLLEEPCISSTSSFAQIIADLQDKFGDAAESRVGSLYLPRNGSRGCAHQLGHPRWALPWIGGEGHRIRS